MKAVLLSLAVVLACITTVHSSPFHNWRNEIEDLNARQLLKLQQRNPTVTPPRLNCFVCPENCSSEEMVEECEVGSSCATVEGVNTVTGQQLKVKVCLPSPFCSLTDDLCNSFNSSNDNEIGSCQLSCCNTDLCNAEPTPAPPTTPTTEPPTTPTTMPTTEPPTTPTTMPTTEPPTTPTTTPAPVVIALTRTRGTIQTPGFSANQPYGPNLDITWTISGQMVGRGRGFWLNFLTLNTEAGRDFITIRRGNRVVRRLSGVRTRGKRSLPINLFPEDGPCEDDDDDDDDDEPEDFDEYDPAYESLADAYVHYLFRRQRPVLRVCIPGNNQQISINFSSDDNDSGALGFRARFRVLRGDDK